jgi:hypothetical protein
MTRRGGPRRLPDWIKDYFDEAGIATEARGSSLIVNRMRACGLDEARSPSSRTRLLNQIVFKTCRRELLAVTGEYLEDTPYTATYSPALDGVAINRDGNLAAIVCGMEARIFGGGTVEGNFLRPGEHWSDLISRIPSRGFGAAAARRPGGHLRGENYRPMDLDGLDSMTFDEPPPDAPEAVVEECLEASRRIRLERRLAYEHVIFVVSPTAEIAIEPVTSRRRILEVPLRVTVGGRTLGASIQLLEFARDPLPVAVERSAAELAGAAWAAALLSFAAITCFEVDEGAATSAPEPRETRLADHRLRASSTHRAAPRRQSGSPWPRSLRPVGPWSRAANSLVAAHVRRLPPGHVPSDEAEANAVAVGIRLRPGETWVRSHVRGVPEGGFRFAWAPPLALAQWLEAPSERGAPRRPCVRSQRLDSSRLAPTSEAPPGPGRRDVLGSCRSQNSYWTNRPEASALVCSVRAENNSRLKACSWACRPVNKELERRQGPTTATASATSAGTTPDIDRLWGTPGRSASRLRRRACRPSC